MALSTEKLKEIFVGGGLIKEEEFESARHDADRFRRPVLEAIVGKGMMDERFLMEAIAEYFKVPIYQKGEKVERFGAVPEHMAKELGVFVLGETEERIRLGMVDVTDYPAQNYVERLIGKPSEAVLLPRSDFNELLRVCEAVGGRGDGRKRGCACPQAPCDYHYGFGIRTRDCEQILGYPY
jgi:hypothetical protein